MEGAKGVVAICIFKEEVGPHPSLPSRILKLCTFKVRKDEQGRKLGGGRIRLYDLEEPIGSQVDVQASDITCEIVPAKQSFEVGDTPIFDVVLHNKSDKTFFLVYSVEGSNQLARYPHRRRGCRA